MKPALWPITVPCPLAHMAIIPTMALNLPGARWPDCSEPCVPQPHRPTPEGRELGLNHTQGTGHSTGSLPPQAKQAPQ